MSLEVTKFLSKRVRPAFSQSRKQFEFLETPQEANRKLFQQFLEFNKDSLIQKKTLSSKKGSITKYDYPKIVKLRLAGHTDENIAKKLGVNVESLKPHLSRALASYRAGDLNIDNGGAVEEGRARAYNEAVQTVGKILEADPETSPSVIHGLTLSMGPETIGLIA